MIKTTTKQFIKVSDWDKLVEETYGRPYNFQQQDGCQDRGIFEITVPSHEYDDYENDTVPEVVNGPEMGVSFEAWLKRDPKQPLGGGEDNGATDYRLELWWTRNFYPNIQMVANDLHAKGLLPAGTFVINIDW